ncbi:hypothetical protein GGS26DRAFT_445245 [Hypomontagnella submonticulosa]|nr:hypothetical protein GGS26DRAFT_445245 [Hypomontagnella submonticulosa]
MRFSILVTGLFAAVATAQSDSTVVSTASDTAAVSSVSSSGSSGATEAPSSTSGSGSATVPATLTSVSIDPAQTSAQAAMIACINACDPADVTCQAKCISVPSPDTQNVNATTDCVAKCPQGNGTATDNLNYADCVSKCIGQYYYTTSGTPNLQTSSGSSGASTPSVTQIQSTVTSDGSTFVTSFSSTVAPSGSGSADSASSTSSSSAGADMLFSPVGSGIGLFSFLAAFLAL